MILWFKEAPLKVKVSAIFLTVISVLFYVCIMLAAPVFGTIVTLIGLVALAFKCLIDYEDQRS